MEEHLAMLTLKQSRLFPGGENAISKTLYDFVPYKMLATECCKLTHGVTANGLCLKPLS